MDYDTIMQKLATADLPINQHLVHTMNKVRAVGLHKTAAIMHGVPHYNIKVATQLLGRQMMASHLKFKKIAGGLGALNGSGAEPPLKQASLTPLPTAGNRNPARTQAFLNLLKEMQQPTENMTGRQLGGAMNRGRPGMFKDVGETVNTFGPAALPEMPAMGRLPTGP